jgi:transposase
MARRQILDKELRRQLREADQLYDSEKDDTSGEDGEEEHNAQRGRKFIQFAWSRVISVQDDKGEQLDEHWIRRDQIIQSRVREDNKRLTQVDWKPLFFPDELAKSI